MKQPFKNYLKLGILLFGIPLLLITCEKDNILLDSNQTEVVGKNLYQVNTVKLSQIPEVRDFLIGKTHTDIFSRTTINGAIFDDDNILEVIDTLSNANYTFRFTYPDTPLGEFYNLIVGKTPEGENKTPYVLKYICDDEFLDMYIENNFDFQYFRGTASLHKYTDFFEQGSVFGRTTSISTTNTDTNCPPEYDENGDPISCETVGVVGGGSGGGGGFGDGSGPGDGSGSSGGDNGSGVSGGPGFGDSGGGQGSGGSSGGGGGCTVNIEYISGCVCNGTVPIIIITIFCPSTNRSFSYNTNNNDCPSCPTGSVGGIGVLPPAYDDQEPPCKNLKKLTDNPTNIATRFNQLRNETGNFEKGFRVDKIMNSLNSEAGDMEASSNTHSVDIPTNALTFAIAHNHPNEDDFLFFSGNDILNIVPIINNYVGLGFDEAVTFTLFLVANGETYAIKFNDMQSIQNLKDIFNSGIDAINKFHRDVNDVYGKDIILQGATTSITKQQRRLYDFLDSLNINSTFLQATYNSNGFINGWEKINKDTLAKEPCN